jgi:mRNA interferase MazF
MNYKPPKPPLVLKSVPRFGQVFWCDFSISNVLPEFDDVHPVIVIRSGQKLANPHLVVPMTSIDHTGDVYAYRMPVNPNPKQPDRSSWVLCNHIYTVASERLKPIRDRYNNPVFPEIGDTDLAEIGTLVRKALNRILGASLGPLPRVEP